MNAPRIGLIHATALAMQPIQEALVRRWPQAQRMNLLDDSLSVDRARDGGLTPAMVQRFEALARYAQDHGCGALLFTCSAFGPAIEAAAAATGLPTLKPNEAMFEQALALGRAGQTLRLGLVATFEASIPSLSQELLALARERGIDVDLRSEMADGAMADLAQGHAESHHRKVAQAAATLADCHAVMLAQFSMAAAQEAAQAQVPCPVLSSPDCAVQALMRRMGHA